MKKLGFFFSAIFIFSCSGGVPEDVLTLRRLNGEQSIIAAKDAYIFGYPLVYSHITKQYMTSVSSSTPNGNVNNIIHYPLTDFKFQNFQYPDPQTYYSCVWLDVSKEPVLFEIPIEKTLAANFVIFDAWTNAVLNSSHFDSGEKTLKFAVTSKMRRGILPKDFIEVNSHTDTAFFVYGIKNEDKQNFSDAVKKHRKNIKVYPLNSRKNFSEIEKPVSQDPPLKQMRSLPIEEFFNILNSLMLSNAPFEKDAQTLENALDIGVSPGMRFEPSSFSEPVLEKIKLIPLDFAKENSAKKNAAAWEKFKIEKSSGYYLRAKNAFKNIFGALDLKAERLLSEIDADGEPFDSSKNQYVLHFEKSRIPKDAWSVSIYDADGFLMKNQINRYVLSSNNKLKKNSDGSLNIYIQKNRPQKDKTSNWLPSPKKSFKLIFKIYPPTGVFDASILPAVKKVKPKR
ncbi:MAG: DUF1214 domain-containing protein [Endomicrobium sp.]|jgi:hypothetical protein|nr:DUF1214 domain-containing protein [Endomicrobium sp.]